MDTTEAGQLNCPTGQRVRRAGVRAIRARAPAELLVIGGDADGNLGDQAIMQGVCSVVARLAPTLPLRIVSRVDPEALHQRGLPDSVQVSLPAAAGLLAPGDPTSRVAAVLIAGGGLFQDDDSRIKMPYWAARVLMLGQGRRPVAAVSLGAGPLRRPESRQWARLACAGLASLSVRDPHAAACLGQAIGREVAINPDPALLVRSAPWTDVDRLFHGLALTGERPLLGIALRRWFNPRGGFLPASLRARMGLDRNTGAGQMAYCLEQLATVIRSVCAALGGARPLFMPSYPLGHEGDVAVCRTLASTLADLQPRLTVIRSPALYRGVCERLSLMISGRMHPLLLAASAGVPVVGLRYNDKFEGLCQLLGMPRALIGVDALGDGDQTQHLVDLAQSALTDQKDTAARCQVLAQQSESGIAAALRALDVWVPQ